MVTINKISIEYKQKEIRKQWKFIAMKNQWKANEGSNGENEGQKSINRHKK